MEIYGPLGSLAPFSSVFPINVEAVWYAVYPVPLRIHNLIFEAISPFFWSHTSVFFVPSDTQRQLTRDF